MTRFVDAAARAARIATGVLGWSPDSFWASTPADLLLALEGATGGKDAVPAAGTAVLQALVKDFPDG